MSGNYTVRVTSIKVKEGKSHYPVVRGTLNLPEDSAITYKWTFYVVSVTNEHGTLPSDRVHVCRLRLRQRTDGQEIREAVIHAKDDAIRKSLAKRPAS